MANNSLLTIGMITRELLKRLENNLAFTKGVNRNYDDRFAQTGAKIGDTLDIRLPPRFMGRSGRVVQIESLQEQKVSLTLDQQYGVDLDFTSKDLALTLDDFSDRFLQPAAAKIANKIDADGLALYKQVYNSVGVPGTVPNALLTYGQAMARLGDNGVPFDGMISTVIDPWMQATIVDAAKAIFNPQTEIAAQYKNGNLGQFAGSKFSMDQNVATHTVGTQGGTPVVDGAGQTGSSLVTKSWSNSITNVLRQGDVITIAGVQAVNPVSKQTLPRLQQFVVTANANSGASTGPATLSISPAITLTGPYQTVNAAPADAAAITVVGASAALSPQGLTYHRDAFVLGCADLPIYQGAHMCERISDDQLGLSIRMWADADITNDVAIFRTDVLYGWLCARPEMACRVQS